MVRTKDLNLKFTVGGNNMVRDNGDMKGKINWFTIEHLIDFGIIKTSQDYINPTEEDCQTIKRKLVEQMIKEKFTFFPFIGYRIKLNNRGRIKEFGVQFKSIE